MLGMLASNRELAGKVNTMEFTVPRHKRHIAEPVDSIAQLTCRTAPITQAFYWVPHAKGQARKSG